MVQVYVSRLRKALGDGGVVTTRARLRLALAPDELDLTVRAARRRGRARRWRAGHPAAAAALARGAGAVARAAARRARLRAFAPARDRAAATSCGWPRSSSGSRRTSGCGRHTEVVGRAGGAHRRASVARAPARPADARAVSLRPPGRRAARLPGRAARAASRSSGSSPGSELRGSSGRCSRTTRRSRRPRRRGPAVRARGAAAAGAAAPDARRIVSVVFADLADSTALAERLDPEALHGCSSAARRSARRCSSATAATVEEFVGDAVVGVFGLRERHEDDAAAGGAGGVELREAVPHSAPSSSATRHPDRGRLGVNSGEVFVGPGARGERVRRGDAMNVAAAAAGRRAADGEILLGERRTGSSRRRSVPSGWSRSRSGPPAEVEPGGCSGSQPRSRRPRAAATPFVGRERELDALRAALARAAASACLPLVTVVGPPGIGKSRLVARAGRGPSAARRRSSSAAACPTARGSPTGRSPRSSASWPATIRSVDRASCSPATSGPSRSPARARRDRAAGEPAQAEETFWAVRRLLEAVGARAPARRGRRRRPLGRADAARPARVRRRVLERRADPAASASPARSCSRAARRGRRRSRAARCSCSRRCGRRRAGAGGRAPPASSTPRRRGRGSSTTAEGNPLFLEQLVAVGREKATATLPPSIAGRARRAHRPARAGRARGARARLGRGAELPRRARSPSCSPSGRDAVDRAARRSCSKQLLRPDRPELAGEDAFRFSHALIRDAAYERHAEAAARRAARARRRLAAGAAGTPTTRSSATTSSRPAATGVELGRRRGRRALAREAAERLAGAAPARARCAATPPAAAAPARARGRRSSRRRTRRAGAAADARGRAVRGGQARGRRPRPGARRSRAPRPLATRALGARARVEQRVRAAARRRRRRPREARAGRATRRWACSSAHGDDLGRCRAWRLRGVDRVDREPARARPTTRGGAPRRTPGAPATSGSCSRSSAGARPPPPSGPTPVPEAIRRCERIREQVRSSPVAAGRDAASARRCCTR